MDAPPVVSLLISTKNRSGRLQACLDYVARQTLSCSWELVVVDNGSTDCTASLLADYVQKASFPVTLLSEPAPGKSRALNTGLRRVRGDIIVFIDDDCYLARDCIDQLLKAFADEQIGFAGGRVVLFDPSDAPFTLQTSTERQLLEPRSYVQPGWMLGANMAFRREVVEQIGGFDPDLGPGARFHGEDPDIQARASFAGWWGLYTPDAVVAHHHGRKAADVPRLRRNYALGNGAYMAKFLLRSDSRSTYLRGWYWHLRRTLAGRYALRDFLWEIPGAVRYFAYRLRKRIARAG